MLTKDNFNLELMEVTFHLFGGLKKFNTGEECVQKDGSKRDFHLEINRRQAR